MNDDWTCGWGGWDLLLVCYTCELCCAQILGIAVHTKDSATSPPVETLEDVLPVGYVSTQGECRQKKRAVGFICKEALFVCLPWTGRLERKVSEMLG